jgi:hypothetical protein
MRARGKRLRISEPMARLEELVQRIIRTASPLHEPCALSHELGVSPGAVDVPGVLPEDVRVAANITEGHQATKRVATLRFT